MQRMNFLLLLGVCCLAPMLATGQTIGFIDDFDTNLSQWQIVGTPLTIAGGLLHVIPSTADAFPNEARIKSNERIDFDVINRPIAVDWVISSLPNPAGLHLSIQAQNSDNSDDPDRRNDRSFILQGDRSVHLSTSNAGAGMLFEDGINPIDFRVGIPSDYTIVSTETLTLRMLVAVDGSLKYFIDEGSGFVEIHPNSAVASNNTRLSTIVAPKFSVNVEPLSGTSWPQGATNAFVDLVKVTFNFVPGNNGTPTSVNPQKWDIYN